VGKTIKTIVYDRQLQIEAYHFEGIAQPFPNHFHDYYVIGFIENGKRNMTCQNHKYLIQAGDMIIFNPYDSHECVQIEEENLNYRAINISKDVMQSLHQKIIGYHEMPYFQKNVLHDEELSYYFLRLHQMILDEKQWLDKEEDFLLIMTSLIYKYSQSLNNQDIDCSEEVEWICSYLQEHYAKHICLDDLCNYVHLSQSTLLRSFTKEKGITPYRYLLTMRINKAKELLEKGIQPIHVAMQVGFSDQSHFTNCFRHLIGLSPGMYYDMFIKNRR